MLQILLEFNSPEDIPERRSDILIALECENKYDITPAQYIDNKFYDYINDTMYTAGDISGWIYLDCMEECVDTNEPVKFEPNSTYTIKAHILEIKDEAMDL
jgi:hypothetical protein